MTNLLNFLVALRRLPPLSALTGDEERMLFELRELWTRQGHLTVADVYDLAAGKSASTAYRQLVSLTKKGLLDVSVIETDRRRRLVSFTPAAEKIFRALA